MAANHTGTCPSATTAAQLAAIIKRRECLCGHGRRSHNDGLGGCSGTSVRPSQGGRRCPCGHYDVPRSGEEQEVDYYRELGPYAR